MAQGFILESDPQTTVYRRVKIASGSTILAGTCVDQSHSGSATVDVAVSTASSVTSALYGVTVETIPSTATSVLIALITPEQTWSADVGASGTTGGGTAVAAYNGLRSVIGYQTITVGTTSIPAGFLTYLGTSGVATLAAGVTSNLTTVYNTGSDVTGTTGLFIQQGLLPAVSTSRVFGRFLIEHAA